MGNKISLSTNQPTIMYLLADNIVYCFGKGKPINIIFSGPSENNSSLNDQPMYIGYYDGTCEYPVKFDYVRSRKNVVSTYKVH